MRGSRPPKKPRAIAAEGSTLARAPPLLRVCSYNVLAQTHLETHSHLYRGAPPDALDGPTRLARLISQLAGLGADVLALQEVEPPVFAALSQALGAYGVRGVYKQRTGAGQPDGVAVFLRTPRLQLLCVEEVEFAALAKREPDLVVPPPSAELALRLRRQADKGQVALLVTVLDTQSGGER
ncbi:hypothetical protein EMIHUDRAFT_352683 [Emiliania huxleyi CCMP1516]|uniref:Endonuclease/exonuclease/phosphatase domain-containing protein n=2 Tax=Emiliania huxleyi TaxID=2903 RepID=A0A0D3K8W4_EMIH1|nr:hypothetical protein EMIHUDRAFT_352683 [Emiliania huxleyi CCMP1516]EOD32199.1 hypothetical protein EMIHUDRAFT_352683 [Emiliania huxleyi CCMP1516]|eukprot:XP_005784628.1 hypothetical protein EMIHUDRAFT_352683 [Emiliania huxleyi CCMP1516]